MIIPITRKKAIRPWKEGLVRKNDGKSKKTSSTPPRYATVNDGATIPDRFCSHHAIFKEEFQLDLRFSKSVETPARNRVYPEKCGYGQGIDEQGDEIFDHKD